ncbi:MAG: YeeE/YedE family protein [Deltaproteobacteria bacterium]|nr:YeeE/YedE family protein [Deltaproteobacteria bacterium]
MKGDVAIWLAVLFGFAFGVFLQKGRVTDYNVIVRQFLLKDFTVIKVMLTAVIVGGLGVLALHSAGYANFHIKSADMLGMIIGSAIFGIGMVVYGYCPGTGVAAIGSGSIHALIGAAGMLAGGMLYAFSYPWVKENVLTVASLGKVRLPDITGVPDIAWFALLIIIALPLFRALERRSL